ncbi:MAG: redoxin domain-containing protein [Deferrisomatales bacterium]
MTKTFRWWPAAVATIWWAVVPAVAAAQGTAMRLDIGDRAPDFTLEEFATGRPVSLHEYLGKKVIMLEFWATWCDICKVEMPRLEREYAAYKDKGYVLLGITLSRGDKKEREKIRALVDKHHLTYPLLLDKEFEVATKIYGLSGPIPLKAIIDCQGVIRYTHVGDYADGVSEVPFVLDELLADPTCQP